MNYYQIYKKSRFLLLVAMLLSVSWIHAQNEEIFAVEQNQEITPNQPITATRSVTITPGLDSAWLTDMSMGSAWVNPLEFIASIYYPSSTTTYTFVNSMRGTNNPKDGELQTDGTAGGSGYKPESMNLPRCGGYLVFEPQQDGSLIVPIRVFTNKPLFVTDGNGKVKTDIQFKDASGQTYTLLTTTLCAVSETDDVTGFVSFNVTKGEKYYVFSTGSKARFGGCVFSTETIEIDPATMKDVKDILEGATATTAEPYAVLSDNNTVLTFYYDDQKESRGGMDVGPFSSTTDRMWHSYRESITSVAFDASFADYTQLTSTAMWFYDFTNMNTISGLSNLKTNNVTSMYSMFGNCTSLRSLDISGLNTANVTNMESLFSGCSALTSINLTGINTANVTNMGFMFNGCSSINELDLSGFNTSNVTTMVAMFFGDSQLKTIYVSNLWNVENVISHSNLFSNEVPAPIRRALPEDSGERLFENCELLVGGKGTSYNANHVNVDYAHIDGGENNPGYFTDVNTTADNDLEIFVIDSNSTFTSGESITPTPSIVLTPGNNTEWLVNDYLGFDSQRSSIDFAANTYYPNKTLTKTFSRSMCGTDNPVDDNGSSYVPQDKNLPSLGSYFIFEPKQDGSLILPVSINASKQLFVTDGNGNINTDIQVKNANGQTLRMLASPLCAFSDMVTNGFISMNVKQGQKYYVFCTGSKMHLGGYVFSTEAIEIDSGTMSNVKDALAGSTEPYAILADNTLTFYYDNQRFAKNGMSVGPFTNQSEREWSNQTQSITTVVFDASFANCTTVNSTAYWFDGCSTLTSIRGIDNLKTDNVTNMESMFNSCSSLTSLDLRSFNTANVTDMAGMFALCSSLTSLDLSNFNTANVTNMRRMFYDCSGLTGLHLSNFNTGKVKYMDSMFQNCSNITTITVGEGWTVENLQIGKQVFLNCTSLKGGAGTTYDASHVDHTYAHIDGGENNPGYFTDANASTEPTFDYNGVLTVNGQTTMQEALQTVGNVQDVVENISALVWNSSVELTEGDLENFSNPNMLIYVKGASRLDENRQNVIINGTARSVELTDSIFVNGSTVNGNFYCPEEFVAEKITFTHLYNQQTEIGVSRGWETLTLPFNVQSILNKKNGSIIAPFGNDASDKHFWLRQVGENGLTRATQIEANMPYLISMPNNPSYGDAFNQNGTVIFSAGSTVVPKTEFYAKELVIADTLRVMVFPVFLRQTATEYVYALNVGAPTGNYPEGSVFVSNLRAVNPFEVYTFHESNNHPAPMFLPLLDMEGGTTGIEELRTNSVRQDDKWYDLRGRRLSAMPTEKGIYIFNGKKIVK